MFWIGLIVGIIIGWIGSMVFHVWSAMRKANMSLVEFISFACLAIDAGNNRESTITVTHEGEVLNELVLEEE